MDDKSKKPEKTIRDDTGVVSSGVTPAGKTQKDAQPVISAGVTVPPTPTAQIISAGIVSAPGAELVLNNKNYKILKTIARSTGEAEVYLVERENQRFIFKYYYPKFRPKESILVQLKGLHHDDIVDLIDYGYYCDRFFEILEYAAGGSLMDVKDDGTYKYIPIKNMKRLKQIIEETINALNFCHTKGIIHRDIKPENIFFKNPDGTNVLIGDFGISSMLDEGLSKHVTGQERTEIYAAPELYQSIGGKTVISKEVDYYALGISLIHIWSGEEPFKDLCSHAIMVVKCDGKVYIPEDMDRDLENLIKGLITVEPSQRWGYNEVQKWLKGEHVPVYYKSTEYKYEPFPFGVEKGEELIANNPEELSDLLFRYPVLGKKHLYKGRIQRWLEKANDALFTLVEKIVEDEYPRDEAAGLIKAAYILDPTKSYKTFSGVECRTSAEIGDAIEQEASYYRSYLTQEKNADLFLYFEARDSKDIADAFRKYAQAYKPERAFNTMVLELQGKDKFKINNVSYTGPEALLIADVKTKDKFVQLLKNPDSKLSIWLEQYQKLKSGIDKWRKLDRHNITTLSYALEKGSPFHFFTDLVYSESEFKSLFAKYITDKKVLNRMTTPGDVFIDEANFWLKNYQNTDYITVVIEHIKKNVPNLEKHVFSALLDYTIETGSFNVDYYWDTLKPMIEKGESQVEERTLQKMNNLLEKRKNEMISEYNAKLREAMNLMENIENEFLFKTTYETKVKVKEVKDKISNADLLFDGNSRIKVEQAIKLLNEAIDDAKRVVLPEIERIKKKEEFEIERQEYARQVASKQ